MKKGKKMFIKALSVMLAVVLTLTAAPLSGFVGLELPEWLDFSIKSSAAETSGTCGENLTWTYDTSTCTLTVSGTGAMRDYDYNNRPWESYEDSIKTVVIEDGVTTIGDDAFSSCEGLTSVTIPNTISIINYASFMECYRLTSVTIPNGVTKIGNNAFWKCTSLTDVTISDTVTTIGFGAFGNCTGLANVIIPSSVSSIGDEAFYYCYNLTSIVVDCNNQYYANDEYGVLFNKNKTKLIQYPIGNTRKSYIIPNSVTTVGYRAFLECNSLTSITVPNSITKIETEAFAYCRNLTSITIPDSVTSIKGAVFQGCEKLECATIDCNVTTISSSMFCYCENLTSVVIPASVTSIDNRAFYDCYRLTDVYYNGTEEQWNDISFGSYNERLTNATIHYNSTGLDDAGHTHDYVNGVCTICGSNNPNEPGTITITENPIILASGDNKEYAITAIYKDNSGNSILNADIQWTISDNSIAEIVEIQNGYGSTLTFKAKKDGAVKFIASYLDKTATCYVFVGKMSPQLYINPSEVQQTGNKYDFNIFIENMPFVDISAFNQQQIQEATANNVKTTIELPEGFSFDENKNIRELTTVILNGNSVAPGDYEKVYYTIYKVGEPDSNKMTITASGSNASECKQIVELFVDGRDLTEENRQDIKNDIRISFDVLDDYKKIQQRGGRIEHGYRYANSILDSNEIPIKVTIYNAIPAKYQKYKGYIQSNSEFDCTINNVYFTTILGGGFIRVSLDSLFFNTTIKCGESITVYGTAKIKDGYLPMQDTEKEKNLSTRVTVTVNEDYNYGSDLNITVKNISYKGTISNQNSNPSTELKKIPNGECSLVGLGELGLSNQQCTYLSKLILTELAIYSLPTQSLKEYISEKILKKVFGYKKLLSAGNGEFVITIPLEINGEKIEVDLINTVFGAAWDGTGIGNVDSITYEAYKIGKGFLGKQKRAETPYKTGVAGVATIANVKEFFNAVCDYSLEALKSASKSALGNVEKVERFLFGDCALNILQGAGYDTFFDLGWSIYVNECKEIAFECPIDIYVYNQDDALCGTIINNVPISMNDDVELEVINDTKIVRLYDSGYYIKTISACEGKLNVSVTERDYNNGARRIVAYDNLPLKAGTEYTQSYGEGFNVDASTYDVVFEDGSMKSSDSEFLLLEENFSIYNYTFSIQNPSRTEIRHKDGIKLHANIEGTSPAGSYVKWTASNGKFKTEEINNGNSLKIVSNSNGKTTFTATLCSADGEVLATDTIEMKSKAGFFDKIGSFFRSLFGLTKIYEN